MLTDEEAAFTTYYIDETIGKVPDPIHHMFSYECPECHRKFRAIVHNIYSYYTHYMESHEPSTDELVDNWINNRFGVKNLYISERKTNPYDT